MQVVRGQKQKARGRGGAIAAVVDGRAEFRELFVSLVDPSGLLDMKRCGKIAARMSESATRSGYGAGARMASLLADIFADAADVVDRPAEDGALHQTAIAYRETGAVLYDTVVSYMGSGGGEPVGALVELRRSIAVLRSEADARRARLGAADPPGLGLPKLDMLYRGKVYRDVVREDMEEIRARHEACGEEPIFPPKPKYPVEAFKAFK